jgi:16S rRNA (cytosine1402-N4)-methyltransferase
MGDEVLQALHPRANTLIADGTLGSGGHSLMILPKLLPDGRLIALDRDPEALEAARSRLREFSPRVTFLHDNYRRLPDALAALGISLLDGLVLDLGMSSPQVDRAERGFSFLREGPLDMRMDPSQGATAEQLINTLPADELAAMLETLGEERFARRIARRIIEERRIAPLTSTTQLARLIAQAVPPGSRHGRLHPATRTFQALRMAVNDELGALEEFLAALPRLLSPKGRAVVLTYHSLEDRLVKRAFAQGGRDGLWTVLTKKPLRPAQEEVLRNPRARSAKLRAVERRP